MGAGGPEFAVARAKRRQLDNRFGGLRGQCEADLPSAGQLDIDLRQQLGVEKRPVQHAVKRVLDPVAAAAGLVVLSPVYAGIAVAVLVDSGRPVLFVSPRAGREARPFGMLKFRTMIPNAIAVGREQGISEDPFGLVKDDPRVTRVGRWLRRTGLDELPQLVNVLRGQMSLIGPRPEAVALSRWYESELPFYFYRHIVRPGMSGWAQVQQGHVTDLDAVTEKLAYDFYYIKNFSAWLDILIAGRTLAVIASGFGSK